MARVFTITPGLENMGGLKTGGQGSIYKGRRIGEIITAVKILPTPIYSETGDDANYSAFKNEVAKLKKVNEISNPNVVKILSSGLSEQGNFPFIEMEYIEGPDLEEILHTPDHSVFTINEALKVAEQLSNAIAHCHRMDVRHGDIKSNNVKYNTASGNYILLDFGLAMMSDEERRSNIDRLGAIEFMAPEQNSGQMLFQTDVYSFGVVLFELLAGTVPFPLKDKGETARNEVRLAHMTSPVPNLLELRKAALPSTWSTEKKAREIQVPGWVIKMIEKCVEKKPEKRFLNGGELYNFIIQQLTSRPATPAAGAKTVSIKPLAKQDFIVYHQQLKKQLSQYQKELTEKESELAELKVLLGGEENANGTGETKRMGTPKKNRVSSASFVALLFLTLGLGAFAMYPIIKNSFFAGKAKTGGATEPINTPTEEKAISEPVFREKKDASKKNEETMVRLGDEDSASANGSNGLHDQPETNDASTVDGTNERSANAANAANRTADQNDQSANGDEDSYTKPGKVSKKYAVVAKAYFYNQPNEDTKRDEFISPEEKAVVLALNERYGFIYVVITTPEGQVFKGWLRKRDVKLYADE
ncbi:serine/threonine-protein kinase [Segetibacter aerophilus]|uniref:Protein kinase domain-containing protein n=1 Tax=Segetibacter aerophilus TaxID=670293 RepID=A0A512BBZ8_9BACT|nr:serine/threonine-protein kinase [Segetibacter aerophilus]GEO09462.1 hypothetical protein SAE01_19580 [Segetibacter aerophilus]